VEEPLWPGLRENGSEKRVGLEVLIERGSVVLMGEGRRGTSPPVEAMMMGLVVDI